MSYILDALKRSDRERKQGMTPSIHSMHENYFEHRFPERKSRYRSKLLISTSLVLVGGVFFSSLILKSNTDRQNIPVLPNKTGTLIEPRKQVLDTTAQQVDREQPPSSSPATVVDTAPVLIATDKKKIVFQSMPAVQTLQDVEQDSLAPTVIGNNQNPPLLKDLSPSIRAQVPELQFAGHTFADAPNQRMIIINNRILREGYPIDNQTRLIEITWNGVILEFEGQQFMIETEH